jgi:hypothetical protein
MNALVLNTLPVLVHYLYACSKTYSSAPQLNALWCATQLNRCCTVSVVAVAYKERPASPAKEKSPAATQKGKPKGKPDKGAAKDKVETKSSRPPSQQFDVTKPHWTLRVVVDASIAVSSLGCFDADHSV